ncbi:MAG: hypothetical protein AAFQ19_16975 [Pseudomonadota bacterium]
MAAIAAIIALLLGSGWWIALAIYAFGGAALTLLLAWLVSRREEDVPPRQGCTAEDDGQDAGARSETDAAEDDPEGGSKP